MNWWPGVLLSSAFVVGSWSYLIGTGSISTIWPMFGAANQLLGTLALCIGTTVLIKMWKSPYLWVTALPMPRFRAASADMAVAAAPPLPVEAGKSTLSTSVSGSVQMK